LALGVGTDELSVLRLEGFATSTPRQEPPMSETPISDLRRRMLEDKAVCNFIERLLGPPNEGAENKLSDLNMKSTLVDESAPRRSSRGCSK
jgi:hypothetical protein